MLQRGAIVGVLLAGGRARRLGGGDKCLRTLGGVTLLARAIDRAAGQVSDLVLSANGDPGRFRAAGLPVVADIDLGQPGPLAGLWSALEWAAAMRPGASHVATFATDTPFFPRDVVARLAVAPDGAVAESGGQLHPTFGLWPVGCRPALRAFFDGGGCSVTDWAVAQEARPVPFDTGPLDSFFNINTPDDLVAAAALLRQVSD